MDRDNRPRSREKNVTSGGNGVQRRGQELGTGPVGTTGSHRNSSTHQGGRSGSSGGGRIGVAAVLLIVFMVIKTLFGGNGSEDYSNVSYDNNITQTVTTTANGQAADETVAAGSRGKFTSIIGNNQDTVTIMVYMCGTDLESKSGMASSDLKEMMNASLSSNINIVVYTGGCRNWKISGISSSTNQIYQIKDGRLNLLEDDMGNDSMTKPSTLATFIKYCSTNFPANRNELILWDHGGGSITGYGYDEKNPNSGSMNLAGINQALNDGGVKFDFIGFDACLMATVENGLMLEKHADYMIASEETEPGVGWYYTNWLNNLSNNTSMATVEIGKNIADDFVSVCNSTCPGQKTTLSVVDLAELKNTVPDKLSAFATELNESIQNNEYKTIANARNNTREFAQSSKIDQIDFVHFCENLNTKDANELRRALKGAVKYNRTGTSINNANGLAIYFPYKKTSKVSNAVNTYEQIDMDDEYTQCIREFASLQAAGQIAAGGNSSPVDSLLGTALSGNSSGGSSDIIGQMLNSFVGGNTSSSGLDSSLVNILASSLLSTENKAQYVADNYFDSNNLVWNSQNGNQVITLSEDQWSLVENIDLNVFYDDGEGYVDLGLDNTFEFDEDGNLIGDYDNTWIAINSQPVAYYHTDTKDDGTNYTISGYVPCMLNGERAQLILVFDNDNPKGYIAGAQRVYTNNETETIAKSMVEVKAGDTVDFICDFYSYDGVYQDSYYLGEQMVLNGNDMISNVNVGNGDTVVTYKFTDIYQNYYWTKPVK